MRGARIGIALLVCLAMGAAGSSAFGVTLVGNKIGNLLVGTKGNDRLLGKGGGDLLKGKAGPDLLIGGRGRDGVVGGPGRDRIIGGRGNDVIRATDGRADRQINGGPGANTCVVDIPADLPVTSNCGTLRAGSPPGGGGGGAGVGGGGPAGSGLTVTTAQGLLCLPLTGCLFTITGRGADALVGSVSYGGAVTSVANVAVNAAVTGTWLATGVYSCSGSGDGWLIVTIGSKSTPPIPVNC